MDNEWEEFDKIKKMYSSFDGFAPQGWQCPVCRRVYSPSTTMCYYCGGQSVSTVTYTNKVLQCPVCGRDVEPGKLCECIRSGEDF